LNDVFVYSYGSLRFLLLTSEKMGMSDVHLLIYGGTFFFTDLLK
jgi:hypothetical protein